MKTLVKILNKYVMFWPHSKSLDNTIVPPKEVLKKFKLLNVNIAIAGGMKAIANQPMAPQTSVVLLAMVNKLGKENAKLLQCEILNTLRTKVTTYAHIYTDISADDLRVSLDAKYKSILEAMDCTRHMFTIGT